MKFILTLLFIIIVFQLYSQDNQKKHSKKRIKVIEYYESGSIKEKGKKKFQTKLTTTPSGRTNGIMEHLKHGKWTEFYPDGRKKRLVKYKKGDIIKVIKLWDDKGVKN